MSNADLTRYEKLVFAEITSAIVQSTANVYENLRTRYIAGTLQFPDLIFDLIDMIGGQGLLLQRYAKQMLDSGHADLAEALTTWADGYDGKAAEMRTHADHGEWLDAMNVVVNVLDFPRRNIPALIQINLHMGEGSGKVLKTIMGKAGPFGLGVSAADIMYEIFSGNTKAAAALSFGLVAGLIAQHVIESALLTMASPVILVMAAAATVSVVGLAGAGIFDQILTMLGIEDPSDAAAAVTRALQNNDNAVLGNMGNHLFWGDSEVDTFTGYDDKPNDMIGMGGDDWLTGGSKGDHLNGGIGDDKLEGNDGDDTILGGTSGNDTLIGGAGNDTLEGGVGVDCYEFTLADFLGDVTEDTISDQDGQGKITFEGYSIAGTGIGFRTIHDASFGTWLTSDEKFRLSVLGDGDNQSLIITHRASGSRIVVNHWKNGDLGIDLPDMDGVNPHNSAPLTGGDDLFGASGSNAGNDQIDGLAGNDGLDGGAGNDVIDGGFDDDLILGGSGNDQLSGSSGNDVIIDGSELINFHDWSDAAGSDGRSERQRVEDDMAQLGEAVLSHGKGWYIRLNGTDGQDGFTIVTSESAIYLDPNASPSGDDVIDGGEGNDLVEAGEGNDTINGGAGNDTIDGGHDDDTISGGGGDDVISGDLFEDAVAGVNFAALVSDKARKNGNDVIDAGAGNDKVAGGGGNDVIYGGDGDDTLVGRGGSKPVDSDDMDRDYIDGGAGADMISGDDGDDTLLGGDGNDVIRGDNASPATRNGNDTLYGGEGDDQLGGDGGNDVLFGGDGADTLYGDGVDIDGGLHGTDLLYGGAGNDTLMGNGGDDSLDGGDGDDVLVGDADETLLAATYHGNDFLSGGAGNDELQGNGGDDVLNGGVGDDTLFGGSGNDMLNGEDGKDELAGGDGNDRLAGGAENDQLWGEAGDDELIGGEGDDELHGGAGKDTLSGGAGVDLLLGEDGDDTIDGGAGNDSLYGSAGADRLSGGNGDDYLDGDETSVPAAMHGNDTLDGGAGNDVIHGQGCDDVITGGDGDDLLYGDDFEKVFSGNDRVSGGAGNDVILGGAGEDDLLGDDGDDSLSGGEGDDQLTGGAGNDQLAGGTGNDTYHFERGFGTDQIFQFAGEDSGHDIISFGESITASDLAYLVQGDDLIVSNASSGDVLRIHSYFGPEALADIHYANGDVLTRAQLMRRFRIAEPTMGTNGDDIVQGTPLDDRLYGGAGNDIIYGNDGNDYIDGGDGDDQLYGASGSNMLKGGSGNDLYVISYGSFNIVAGLADSDSGVDVIHFGVAPSSTLMPIYQISGDDLMVAFMTNGGQTGAVLEGFLAKSNGLHVIEFADGAQLTADDFRERECNWVGTINADVYIGDAANNSMDGKAGDDAISGGAGDDYLYGNAGDDTLSGNDGNDRINGGGGADTIYGNDGDDRLDGGAGNDAVSGNTGNDRLEGGSGNDILNGDAGNDTLLGESGNDTLNGDDGDDILNGGLGKDILNGGAGNDCLHGSSGDILCGGIGDDKYYIDYLSDEGNANGSIEIYEDIGGGLDTVYANVQKFAMADNTENMVILWSGDGSSLCNYVGNSLDNVISVDPSAYEGGWGTQSYLIDGGLGADTLIGSDRNDTYVIDQVGDRIIESATGDGQSIDTVRASFSYALSPNSNLENIELIGGGGLTATGDAFGNTLDGTRSEGVDTLIGGGGDDLYILNFGRGGALDTVVEGIDGGVDTIFVERPLGAVVRLVDYNNVENIRLAEVKEHWDRWYSGGSMYGNSGNNVLTGNGKANDIHGDDGNDTLYGGGSESLGATDTLFGDGGDDALYAGVYGAYFYGGIGDDALYGAMGYEDHFYYSVGDGADTIHSSFGGKSDKIFFGENIVTEMVEFNRDGRDLTVKVGDGANDIVRIVDYWIDNEGVILSGNVGQFVFADGTIRKGGLDHLPYTNNPPVTLIDNLSAIAVGDEPFVYTLPPGMFTDATDDTFVLGMSADAPGWLSFDAATRTFTGTPPNGGQEAVVQVIATDSWGQTASASLKLNVQNVIQGTAGSDTLLGTVHCDDIHAGAGNDTLDGQGNEDRLFGGSGDDLYIIGDSDAAIVELAGEGLDTVNATVNYVLGDNVERLVLAADSQAHSGTGNNNDNQIVGNDNDNFLDGGAGADILTGGMGDDTYVVDQAGDQVIEAANQGIDIVQTSINWNLGVQIENLKLMGEDDIDGTGNMLDNVLTGNEGNNRLEGGAGADKLYGGYGDDYLVVESSDDQVFEGVDGGTDVVERRFETNLVLDENVENLVLGTGIETGNGNGLDNAITGNAEANKLRGWNGDDLLQGRAGNDALFGGNGSDDLEGDSGNDYLDGGAGIDQMEGGTGNDTYIVDDSADIVTEVSNAGTDAVQTTTSYTLSANIENLFLTESAGAIDGTGNALDNYLSGNSANNVINGKGGSDTIAAGGGDDLLIGGAGDDKYVFDATSGSDLIDNVDGGFDGVFFNGGITRERLSFGRDGDDLLIFVDAATVPSVRVTNHFLGGDAAIDYVQPDGGNYLTTAQINQIVAGNSTGGEYDQVVEGTSAGEQLVGAAGKDLIKGLAGNDQLFGQAGDDTLQGGEGDDYLAGGGGSGTGSGADRLEGGAGNDTLNGEDGLNALIGGAGDDSYTYGGGQDTIDNTGGGFDGVFFNEGITASQLGFSRDGDDLLITVAGNAANSVRVTGHFLGGDAAIDYVQPASGSMLNTAAINALAGGTPGGGENPPDSTGNDGDYSNVVNGTSAGEQLLGSNGRDLIHGLSGNDTIFGFGGDDKFDGGDGDDYLSGGNGSFSGSGNDILIGGAGVDTLVGEDGNDVLIGGTGNDKYIWQAGSGSDVIDNTGGGTDWLFFNSIDRTRLSFHRSADDLIIVVDGDNSQQVRVQNHFQGGELAISYVQPADGYAIPASALSGLLTPMPAGLVVANMPDSNALSMSLVANGSVMSANDDPISLEDQSMVRGRTDKHGRLSRDHLYRSSHNGSFDQLFVSQSEHSNAAPHISLSRQTQQLIQAMSQFAPVAGEASLANSDTSELSMTLAASHDLVRRFSEPRSRPMM